MQNPQKDPRRIQISESKCRQCCRRESRKREANHCNPASIEHVGEGAGWHGNQHERQHERGQDKRHHARRTAR